ncbi:cytochrome P450, family 2, subfamily X, polypeptide 9 [Silurus meridionalis]|nr:cytochrome P450, family 2, subfamily X, polypeptide 9 [Silurus meridionalis]
MEAEAVAVRIQRPKNFPPGPQLLPIFGSLLDINIKNPLKDFKMVYDSFPLLRSLPLPFKKLFTNNEADKKLASAIIEKHKKTRVRGEPTDFIDCYLDELELKHPIALSGLTDRSACPMAGARLLHNLFHGTFYVGTGYTGAHLKAGCSPHPSLSYQRDNGSSIDEHQLVINILNLYTAGTDTTSNTLLTAFLYLMVYPDIQGLNFKLCSSLYVLLHNPILLNQFILTPNTEKCQQEIDEVLQGKACISFEDRHDMPYTQAVIHECQRIANTVPLSVFHSTTRDTELMGYSIPKGTIIIPNLSSVLRPRMCLGEGLARMELFLILVTLLRRFQFIWPEDAGEPDFTPVFGITLAPRPYRMGVRLRQSAREM